MNVLVIAAFAACALAPSARCATARCYHLSTCNEASWPAQYCKGGRQSPIDIVTADARVDSNLNDFSFTYFDSPFSMESIKNTGGTVEVTFSGGVKVSGGGLSEAYDTLQVHLHWGSGSSVPGSEHTVDGKRYPMELHVVNSKSSYKRDVSRAIADPTGLAVLGFFIEALPGNEPERPAAWTEFASYLEYLQNKDDSLPMAFGLSLEDLLAGVDRTKYYRYLGSLTNPPCAEAVVWTVFKEPIKVSRDLIDRFSRVVRVGDGSSPLLVNNFRDVQPAQPVATTVN